MRSTNSRSRPIPPEYDFLSDPMVSMLLVELRKDYAEIEHSSEVMAGAIPDSRAYDKALADIHVATLGLEAAAAELRKVLNDLIEQQPAGPDGDGEEPEAEEPARPVVYMSLAEAAEATGLSPVTLRRQILAGRIRAAKIAHHWLVRPADVDTYLASRKKNAKPSLRRAFRPQLTTAAG